MTCHRLSLPQQKWTKKLGENKLNSSSQLLQHQQCGSSRQQCPESRDRMNLGFTQPCSKYLPAYSLWVMSIIPCWLIHYSPVNPCVVAWKRNVKRDLYINFFLNMLLFLLFILARLRKKVPSKTRSAHVLWGDRSHTQHFQGMAHCSLMAQFQTFPLLSVIIAAQASPLPLSGHFSGWPSSCLHLHCCWWPQHWRKHFTHALSTRQQIWLPPFLLIPPLL